jgi:hypothetical protein
MANIPLDMNEDELQNFMSIYDFITLRILRDATGTSRGVAFGK